MAAKSVSTELQILQRVAARRGMVFSMDELREIAKEAQAAELSDAGKSIAREIACRIGIRLRPE